MDKFFGISYILKSLNGFIQEADLLKIIQQRTNEKFIIHKIFPKENYYTKEEIQFVLDKLHLNEDKNIYNTIYVLYNSHLIKEQYTQMFLKILENLSSSVAVIFVTISPHLILDTIRSRSLLLYIEVSDDEEKYFSLASSFFEGKIEFSRLEEFMEQGEINQYTIAVFLGSLEKIILKKIKIDSTIDINYYLKIVNSIHDFQKDPILEANCIYILRYLHAACL
jgi:hypothetical protein